MWSWVRDVRPRGRETLTGPRERWGSPSQIQGAGQEEDDLPGKDWDFGCRQTQAGEESAPGRNCTCGLSGRLRESQASTVQFSGGIACKDAGQLCISRPGSSPWGFSQDPYWGCGLRHFFHLDAAFFTPSPSLPPSPTPTPRAHKEEGAPSAACHLTLLSRLVKMGPWGAGASFCPSQGHLSE